MTNNNSYPHGGSGRPRSGAQQPHRASGSAQPSRRPAGSAARAQSRAGRSPQKIAERSRVAGAQASGGSRRPPKKESRGKRFFFGFLRFMGSCICLGIMAVSVLAVMAAMYLVKATENDAELLDLNNIDLKYTTILYAPVYTDTGEKVEGEYVEYQRMYDEENRVWVDLGSISPDIQNAFIAIEDKDFRTHQGFSFTRSVYAAVNEVWHGLTGSYLRGNKQGASTINQQLIKNITGDDQSSGKAGYLRKMTEIFRAYVMDKSYDKDMILEAYLNTIPFTGQIGGVEAAANKYFGCSAADVSLAQAASIAAITNNPVQYSPITNPGNHLERRNKILRLMCAQGYITEAQRDAAVAEPLRLYEQKTAELETHTSNNSWYTDVVIDEVIKDLTEKNPMNMPNWDKAAATEYFYGAGLRIYGTVNPTLQTTMEEAMIKHEFYPDLKVENWVPHDNKGNPIPNEDGTFPEPKTIYPEACMVSLNYDGEICAVVGSMNVKEYDRAFNRATAGTRQVGSTMKGVACYPLGIEYDYINYCTALEDSPLQIITNSNGTTREWPHNYGGGFSEQMVLVRDALAQSLNTIAARVGDAVGARTMWDFATDVLGIDSLTEDDIALAPMCLGATTHGITPVDMAGAYMMYGADGYHVNPHSYTEVLSYDGTVVMSKDIVKVQAVSSNTAYIMNRLLREVMTIGTGRSLALKTTDSVGKTGTTNNEKDETKDYWFVGLSPYYVTATWYGYDEGEPLNGLSHAYGTHPGIKTWRYVMDTVQANYPNYDFKVGTDVVQMAYCSESGGAAGPNCPTAYGWFKQGETLEPCYLHGG